MEVTIPLATREEALALFGLADRNLKCLRDALGLEIAARNDMIRLRGEKLPLETATEILHSVLRQHRSGLAVPEDFVARELKRKARVEAAAHLGAGQALAVADRPTGDLDHGAESSPSGLPAPPGDRATQSDGSLGTFEARPAPTGPLAADGPAAASESAAAGGSREVPTPRAEASNRTDTTPSLPAASDEAGGPRARPRGSLRGAERQLVTQLARTAGHARYMEAMLRNELVFCLGPAGSGKTYLAVNLAVHYLREGVVSRLVLCRPAVEAGEKLGFLPGDLQAKINPYLQPLYDALNEVLGHEQVKRYAEREIIEVLPLAYMRGRTLNNAFIILDEGQNTTVSQMKMFLTRMGSHSRIVVNGDITQVDLPPGHPSGLVHAHRVIQNLEGIAWSQLEAEDIARHPIVSRIVKAYEADERAAAPPRRSSSKSEAD